jgi:zinc transport system substrate-binding protein
MLVTACSREEAADGNEVISGDPNAPLSICVVNYPLRYFAERIGGPDVRVTFPAPSDGDPAFWKPTAEQIAAYQAGDVILLNGAGYAKWVLQASLPVSRMVDTSALFADRYLPIEDAVTHSHGPKGEHEHGDVAFTTWLDPELAIVQARAVRDALARLRPERAAEFDQRFGALEADLRALDAELASLTASFGSRPVLFSHPVYQYFVRRYDINGQAVHWEPDEAPTPEQWDELRALLAEHAAAWMIWEGTPQPEKVDALKDLGLDSVVFEPCGNTPATGDYLSVMKQNVRALQDAGIDR